MIFSILYDVALWTCVQPHRCTYSTHYPVFLNLSKLWFRLSPAYRQNIVLRSNVTSPLVPFVSVVWYFATDIHGYLHDALYSVGINCIIIRTWPVEASVSNVPSYKLNPYRNTCIFLRIWNIILLLFWFHLQIYNKKFKKQNRSGCESRTRLTRLKTLGPNR